MFEFEGGSRFFTKEAAGDFVAVCVGEAFVGVDGRCGELQVGFTFDVGCDGELKFFYSFYLACGKYFQFG